jgi:hypothetical protein
MVPPKNKPPHLAFALKTMTSHEGGFSRGGTPQMDLGVAHLWISQLCMFSWDQNYLETN